MTTDLANVIQTYMDDQAFHENWRKTVTSRDASIPTLKRIVTEFVAGQSDLKTFREQIDKGLRATDTWGATGTGWLMEINKLPKYHGANGEVGLRQMLNGLNASNLGQRIEQFYIFLVQEKDRLQQVGSRGPANPGNAAFIVSLFAFWLDELGAPPIYYVSLRRGLKMLLDTGLLAQSIGLHIGYDAIDVRSAADHDAVLQALASIVAADSRIKTDGYWAEKFMVWITENPDALQTMIQINGPNLTRIVIDHTPLTATPEPLLRRLIGQLRGRILVDEQLVRRIYHALLAGHVILTGPPGTGKTELARLIPELLWQSEENAGSSADPFDDPIALRATTSSAYTTRLVTATDEWSVRTLIGGLAPHSNGRDVSYRVQHGHLTETILSNWAARPENPAGWSNPDRVSLRAASNVHNGDQREFRGLWLVIDEFNRAPIDLALGEALTALGGVGVLRVPTNEGTAELPLPRDFRIIGTLNSFDRNYLNQISEALKRRFAFIEILPPTRKDRDPEQAIVLYKALASLDHLSGDIDADATGALVWKGIVSVAPDAASIYRATWLASPGPVREVLAAAWRTFEVIRIYRQLGTAQAIALFRHLLIAGIVEGYSAAGQWYAALDRALCDTIADQLQVLLPDELDALICYSTLDADAFVARYNDLLDRLRGVSERRFSAQLEALATVVRDDGAPLLGEDELARRLGADRSALPAELLASLFWLQAPNFTLPQFARRLRAFKSDRGL